jgi:hypothetical protein
MHGRQGFTAPVGRSIQSLDPMSVPPQDIIDAHSHCSNHRDEISASEICGCFSCMETFSPSVIDMWVDWPTDAPEDLELDLGTTALCPYCGIDAVLGSASGFAVTHGFLELMHDYWFSEAPSALRSALTKVFRSNRDNGV